MTATENAPDVSTIRLTWTGRKEWGSEGRTYQASLEVATGNEWYFVIDQPSKGYWVLRAWVDGDMKLYRDAESLKDAKAQAQEAASQAAFLAQSLVADLEAAEADLGAAQNASTPEVQPVVETRSDGRTAVLKLKWRRKRTCWCATPLHTMNCGQGS